MLTARNRERKLLLSTLSADESKLVALYGRRRVGKTYLVRETFGRDFAFQHSGYYGGNMRGQLLAFAASLREYGLDDFAEPRSWFEAFELLKELIRRSSRGKKMIFLDELSWMDTPRSDLMFALEGFWNGWASARTDIVLVLCASATSWMLSKVVHNKGGLYNRLSFRINLAPFTLGECEEYATARGLSMSRNQLLGCYMIMGGIPYYWSFLQRGLSLQQNIDELFFKAGAPLADEFAHLYASLFKRPADYLAIIEALCRHGRGMTRAELLAATGLTNSGAFSKKLEELESCGFIRRYLEYGKKAQGARYQLVDNFTLFYYKFLKERPSDEHYWSHNASSGGRNAWLGFAFEKVCLEHLAQIKKALGISGVATSAHSWGCREDLDNGVFGSQVDLLIARKDQVIDLCEMKYSASEYVVTKETAKALRRKVSDFITLTRTKSAVHVVVVAPHGVADNAYAREAQSIITADELFDKA